MRATGVGVCEQLELEFASNWSWSELEFASNWNWSTRTTGVGLREELELEYEESSRVGSYEDGEDDTNGVNEVKGHGLGLIDSLFAISTSTI